MSSLETLGWGPFFSSQVTPQEQSSLIAGRAVADRGPRLLVRFEEGERLVVVPGRLRDAGELPAVGDFVLAEPAEEPIVARVLTRRSVLSRNAAGRGVAEQVLAANVDLAFVVAGLDAGPNPRRLERTLAAVYAGGIEPVVVLTKADLCPDPLAARAEAASVAAAAPVVCASGLTGDGVDALRALLAPGRTGVFVGPSGAGKSTLANALLGAALQDTGEVRASDRRGRHVTTGRHLFPVPTGGAIVDGPGIRDLRLWDGAGLDDVFEDVAALAEGCRYRDCRHSGEPGCAVASAVEAGLLAPERVESLHKLAREAAAQEARRGGAAARAAKRRERELSLVVRRYYRDHRNRE
ncbi:MAG TPA: ribosome small subunit-dependent GTPase A [Anaeromyxobacteraceae bacterium]|nr:ribosome small subunit-dependent GTPase A [Anaeromyxobacteraceae bacterium]